MREKNQQKSENNSRKWHSGFISTKDVLYAMIHKNTGIKKILRKFAPIR